MTATTGSPSPAERIALAFQTLAVSAKNLNKTSGELTKPLASLERSLQHLNLGVACWTRINGDSDGDNYWRLDVGYSRVKGSWRLAIRTVEGREDDPEQHVEEAWPFSEAPLHLRIRAVDKLPEMIEALVKATDATAGRLKKQVAPAQQLAAAVNELINPKRKGG